MRRAGIAVVLAVLLLTGCGEDPEDAVRSTVQAYLDSFVKGDAEKTCSLMTADTRREFVRGARSLTPTNDCATATVAVRAAAGRKAIDALRDAKISRVRIQGTTASVRLKASSGQSLATLTREGGEWRVSSAPGSQ
ncbi:MAG TPA: nuclear transport factor 2 family protein [Thermoleophilaceae bacterium]|nr:nuclear transport factor 2 family protein [Thermoleophilaceae bacterium]